MNFVNIRPLLSIPLAAFPVGTGDANALFNLRAKAKKTDGWFLLKCDDPSSHAASFILEGDYVGGWMLGKIEAVPSKFSAGDRYEVFLYGGSLDLSVFCLDEVELLETLKALSVHGMDDLLGHAFALGWEKAMDDVFGMYGFSERPVDVTFEMLFGGR